RKIERLAGNRDRIRFVDVRHDFDGRLTGVATGYAPQSERRPHDRQEVPTRDWVVPVRRLLRKLPLHQVEKFRRCGEFLEAPPIFAACRRRQTIIDHRQADHAAHHRWHVEQWIRPCTWYFAASSEASGGDFGAQVIENT